MEDLMRLLPRLVQILSSGRYPTVLQLIFDMDIKANNMKTLAILLCPNTLFPPLISLYFITSLVCSPGSFFKVL